GVPGSGEPRRRARPDLAGGHFRQWRRARGSLLAHRGRCRQGRGHPAPLPGRDRARLGTGHGERQHGGGGERLHAGGWDGIRRHPRPDRFDRELMGRVAARTFFFGARPKHRRRGRMGRRIALVLLVAVGPSVVFAAAAFAAYRYDGRRAGQILPGIRIQGVPVGEMSASEARDAIRPLAQRMLDRSIQVRAGPRSWAMTAGSLGESVEVDRAVQEALAVSRSYGWASRAYHRLLHKPVLRSISLSVSYDKQVVDRF